jgi:hypothetical protein
MRSPTISAWAATLESTQDWSLTSLKEKLIRIGGKVVSHGYVAFQITTKFPEILRLVAELMPQPTSPA